MSVLVRVRDVKIAGTAAAGEGPSGCSINYETSYTPHVLLTTNLYHFDVEAYDPKSNKQL